MTLTLQDELDANGLEATLDEAFPLGWARTDGSFLDAIPLPKEQQRAHLAALRERLWPDKEAA